MTLAMPYRDDSRTTLAFILAVLLHVLIGLTIVGFFLFKPAAEPVQNKMFELVAAPPADSQTDEASAPGPPNLTLPNLASPAQAMPTPAEPQQVEATPAPATPVPTPAVVKAPPTPTLTYATTAPKSPSSQPPLTDYQKFLLQHKVTSSAASPQTTGRPVPTVGINVNAIVKNLENAGSGANGQGRGQASTASAGEIQDYVQKLIARLKEVFVPPGGVSGLSAGIHLVIGADGTVVVRTLMHPSGNAEFDDAVRDALRQLTNVDPPPGGAQQSYNFTYTPDGE